MILVNNHISVSENMIRESIILVGVGKGVMKEVKEVQ